MQFHRQTNSHIVDMDDASWWSCEERLYTTVTFKEMK